MRLEEIADRQTMPPVVAVGSVRSWQEVSRRSSPAAKRGSIADAQVASVDDS
jgi:hypothetical protein